jgi:hypothetical protein
MHHERRARVGCLVALLVCVAAGGCGAAPEDADDATARPPEAGAGTPELPVPPGPRTKIAPLRVRNDRARARRDELAWSSIALPRAAALTSVQDLVVIGPRAGRVQAQLVPLARWGSTVSDAAAPIKWLGVALKADVAANADTEYSLERIEGAKPAVDPLDAVVSRQGDRVTIATGRATFVLDATRPDLFASIDLGDGNLYDAAAPQRGPVVVDADGVALPARVDAEGGFAIEESGPVMVVVRAAGHFARQRTGSACASDLAYTARLTFVRGAAHVGVELDLRNECGEGLQPSGDPPWWSESYAISRASWVVPLMLGAATRASAVSERGVVASTGPAEARIEQLVGDVQSPGWRRAAITAAGAPPIAAPAFNQALVALGNERATAAIAMPWMRFREPQALGAAGGALHIDFVSRPVAIGEAQARWGMAQIRLRRGAIDDAALAAERDDATDSLERGLLVSAPSSHTNLALVKARLPERKEGARLARYTSVIERVHADTMATWAPTKKYGLGWPDTLDRDQYNVERASAHDAVVGSNYWSASSSELVEYLRSGDPKWVWDFAFPLELTFLNAVLYNTGTRTPTFDIRSGFHAGAYSSNDQRSGRAFRSGYSSDDYAYDQGSDEAYLVRPTGSIREVFAKACRTALVRYPTEATLPERQREEFVNVREINRQTIQHWNMLRYAAEFERDPQLAGACQARLTDIMTELARDNLRSGVACVADSGNASACGTAASFVYTSLINDFLDAYARHHAGTAGADAARRTVATMARQYADTLMTKRANGTIDVAGEWGAYLNCSFASGELRGCTSAQGPEPVYDYERPSHLSIALAGDPERCAASAPAFGEALGGGGFEQIFTAPAVGWWKGASQAMQNVVLGVGAAEACLPD